MSCIPRHVMQTWKTHSVPDKWASSRVTLKQVLNLKDSEYTLMSDEDNRNFVQQHFPDFLAYYDKFPHGIQRADAIRYMWLYVNGGIYMDLDFETLKDFTELFNDGGKLYIVREANFARHYATNCFMASTAKHPFWLEVIERMKQIQDQGLPFSRNFNRAVMILNTAGPMVLDDCLRETRHNYTYLSNKLINPCSTCNINCEALGSYLKPLQGRSWTTGFEDFFLMNFACQPCNGASIALLIILFIIVTIVFSLFILR